MINEQQLQILTDSTMDNEFLSYGMETKQFRGGKLYKMVVHFVSRGSFPLTDSVCLDLTK
jgi:hypothetical protein